uniref:Uncharacterized protein n=1 Tax=Tanacetum cinerariifolium TaxID=118510 RepID=A0A699I391_TANCI|nr:hypothetical protein [Tanacetum cinerariifolium]
MVKSSSSLENEPCCSKSYKKNTKSLNYKITDLDDKLFDSKNMLFYYEAGLAQVKGRLADFKNQEIKFCEKIRGLELQVGFKNDRIESLTNELELLKKEKGKLETKLTGFLSVSKDLDSLLESQKLDKNNKGLGYSAIPPPPAQVYSPPKKDMSWTGLPEFADDTITDYSRPSPIIKSNTDDTNRNSCVTETRESSSIITSKPAIEFVKAAERPTDTKIDKVETAKKSVVKYAELYIKPSKKSTVRGNQRIWNNLKSQQLGVKNRRTCSTNTHKSNSPRPVVHKTGVKRLERELKARTSPIIIYKVDRGRSRLDKNKEGLGCSVVPPPPTQVYSPPKKDMSWTGLPKFADDTITDYSRPSPTIKSNTDDTNRNSLVTETRESSSIITSRPTIKFVRAGERPTDTKIDKVKSAKKSVVKYAELYRKPSKKSTGNSWTKLKDSVRTKRSRGTKSKEVVNYILQDKIKLLTNNLEDSEVKHQVYGRIVGIKEHLIQET